MLRETPLQRQSVDLHKSPWLAHAKVNPAATIRLFCFPYAGGDASIFARWSEELPTTVEVCPVQLPGRRNRFAEPPFESMSPLVESLAFALQPWLDKPFALFGHSTGALIAFELARRLRRLDVRQCTHLFVSGCGAPHLPPDRPGRIHDLPEAEFEEQLRRFNPDLEAVFAVPELRDLLLPILRADFQLTETYNYVAGALLACPISGFGGSHDPFVRWASLEAWRDQTSARFNLHKFGGAHLFLNTDRKSVLTALAGDLRTASAEVESGR
jgi:medium-chain acyl-[acyl-carrier-protein] hydrolase